ncbi:MAG: S9 family peptidase, partial [Cyclobacteriaceae bacterium]|nr:S9 family peptidase [Cyclobacteriaceae bacterium]
MKLLLLFLFSVMVLTSCTKQSSETLKYPETAVADTTDNYFGERVSDPYRWLENDTATDTKNWVQAENKVTFTYLNGIPFRDLIRKRLEEVYNYQRLSAPFREGSYYYFYKNDGLQNQSVLYRTKGEKGEPEVFLDPNSFSKDGTTSLAGISFTSDGEIAAYQISQGGSDWRKVIVIATSDKRVLEDTLVDVKFSGIAWRGREGFYYSSYDKPVGSALSSKTQHHKLFFHRLGTSQQRDELIFGGDATPRRYIGAGLTEDERFLVVTAATSTTGNELYVRDLKDPKGKLQVIVSNFDNEYNIIDNDSDRLLVQTNWGAPKGRVMSFDLKNREQSDWKVVIPEAETPLEGVSTVGRKMLVSYLKDAHSVVLQYDLQGKMEREITLPGIGTSGSFSGKPGDTQVYYTFASFTYPTTIFKLDLISGKSTLHEQPGLDFDPEAYETKQVFFESKDKTKVPMFITYKKGMELNGKNPTWL